VNRARAVDWGWRLGRWAVLGLAGLVLVFNIGVLVVVFLTSLSDTRFLVFPPRGFTLEWYGELTRYKDAILYSLQVAVLAATIASALGTLSSLTIVRYNFRYRSAVLAFLLSPLIIPSTIFGLAILVWLTQLGWRPGLWPLTIAIAVHTTPFCVRIITSGLLNIDWELEAAARALGASRRRAFMRVILPLAAPSIVAGWVFTFILAFDDSSISVFLARPIQQTYGAQLLADLDDRLTPAIAAAGSAVIVVTMLSLGVLGIVYWVHRKVTGAPAPSPLVAAGPAPGAPESAQTR
jgi:ABC-type spermidine/putrescine transport system permease subunit II